MTDNEKIEAILEFIEEWQDIVDFDDMTDNYITGAVAVITTLENILEE